MCVCGYPMYDLDLSSTLDKSQVRGRDRLDAVTCSLSGRVDAFLGVSILWRVRFVRSSIPSLVDFHVRRKIRSVFSQYCSQPRDTFCDAALRSLVVRTAHVGLVH